VDDFIERINNYRTGPKKMAITLARERRKKSDYCVCG